MCPFAWGFFASGHHKTNCFQWVLRPGFVHGLFFRTRGGINDFFKIVLLILKKTKIVSSFHNLSSRMFL